MSKRFILYGSLTSPYVRRIRHYFAKNLAHELDFQVLDVLSASGQQILEKISVHRRVPILVDKERDLKIFDSQHILDYLESLYLETQTKWTVEAKNDLVLVNDLTHSLMTIFQLRKFELEKSMQANFFYTSHVKRSVDIFHYFTVQQLKKTHPTVIDWLAFTWEWNEFRQIMPLHDLSEVSEMLKTRLNNPCFLLTAPH